MPLPPLPDDAAIGGAGHIADSDKLEAYLRALAEQYKIDIGVLPDPAPGGDGHVTWHNAIVAGAKKVAAAIGAPVTLPPLDVKAGDKSHVTHHNEITKALHDMSEAVPFSVEGGRVHEAYGWRTHTFNNPGVDKLTVKGKGTVEIIVCGGGGGRGFGNGGAYPSYQGGGGGGGAIAEMGTTQRTVPSVVLNTGEYQIKVGAKGTTSPQPSMPASNGENSTFTGADVSLTGTGGGGGGSSQAVGNSAGTGGGGGSVTQEGQTPQTNRAGKGNPGGDGSEGATGGGFVPYGAGGGALGSAEFQGEGGDGLHCDDGNWWDTAVEDVVGAGAIIGSGSLRGVSGRSPGHGDPGFNMGATNGIVIVGYKLAEMLGGK